MFALLYFALNVWTSQYLAPLDCPVTITRIAHGRATMAIPACDGEAAYTVVGRVSALPTCARVVGAWLACESIGYVPPDPKPCYPYLDGHGEWCPYGKSPRQTQSDDDDRPDNDHAKYCPGDWLGHMDRPASE